MTNPSEQPESASPEPTYQVHVPIGVGKPYLTWILFGINLVIFVVPFLLDLLGVRLASFTISELLLVLGAKENTAISLGGQYYRFLTAMFLHGSITHIAFNAWALYSIGSEIEQMYGRTRFLAIYFLAGFAGGVASYAANPSPSVGASGAIFGLFGALGVFFQLSRNLFGGMARQQIGSVVFMILINLGLGFTVPLIDNSAHIGGLVGGALVAWLLAPRLVLVPYAFPPTIERRYLSFGWPGALAVLLVLVVLVSIITPPLGS